jgi:hypothetical protein
MKNEIEKKTNKKKKEKNMSQPVKSTIHIIRIE